MNNFHIEHDVIFQENCVQTMGRLPDCAVDLVLTSPPYDNLRDYKGYHFDFENVAQELFRIVNIGGVVVWVSGDKISKGNRSLTSLKQVIRFQEIGFNVHDIMIYQKKNTPFMRSNAYTNAYEFMFILSKGKVKTFNPLTVDTVRHGVEMLPFGKGSDGVNHKVAKELKKKKTRTNIWSYAVGLHGSTSDRIAFKHPAIFPEKLAEEHILSWTSEGDLVYDPFMGSGTTGKMAMLNNRRYLGSEISQEYCEIARTRINSARIP